MIFTTAAGALVNRQSVVHTIERADRAIGLEPEGLATHTGRRTVITALYANGGLDLADLAGYRVLTSGSDAGWTIYVTHVWEP